jgi:hypothetical protein
MPPLWANAPDVGLVRVRGEVADLVHHVRGLGETRELLVRHARVAELELERGQDRHQVRVPAALAEPVHGPLHEAGAHRDRGDRVRDAALGVVVRVDADALGAEPGHDRGRRLGDLWRQAGAVRVAERHVLGARVDRSPDAAQRVLGVVAVGVEEVLGVVDHALALRDQVGDRVADQLEVLGRVGVDHLLQVQLPRLADERAGRSEALRQQRQRRIVGGGEIAAAGHAEGADHRRLEAFALEQLEQRLLLRVGTGEPGLDEVDAERVESVSNAQLLVGRERHALALHAVTEGRVV